MDYTLSNGLDLVANTAASGSTGLFALTGKVVGDEVELYATNYTINDLEQTYLYGITDILSARTDPLGESFSQLAIAPTDATFKGVAFAPTSAAPEPSSWLLMIAGLGTLGVALRRRSGLYGSTFQPTRHDAA